MSTIYCKKCGKETKNPKFCSRSCSASFNNVGVRRNNGHPVKSNGKCAHCGKTKNRPKAKFCSLSCSTTFHNTGKKRPKNPPGFCKACGGHNEKASRKFCSIKCSAESKRLPIERRRMLGREYFMRYYSKKKYQTPHDEDLSAIREFYKNCPKGCHVDHIIPISKKGPHSLTNLQYLTAEENLRKSNKIV